MNISFEGKVALVTGPGSGMGLATAVLQLCSHPVIGWQNARPGIFGLWSIQVATI
jgi:hypothetical protein